jgi:hypothetical protein
MTLMTMALQPSLFEKLDRGFTKKSMRIALKKHPITLCVSPIALNDLQPGQRACILSAHERIKRALTSSPSGGDDKFYKQCEAEVHAIDIFFPGNLPEATRICFAAWLALACVMDDTLETLAPDIGEAVLAECIEIVRGSSDMPISGMMSHSISSRDA